MIPWLTHDTPLPHPTQALLEPNGLLAASEDISPARLLEAYRQGIFPWYSSEQPVLWWSPDPRMVLRPDQFICSRSLRKTLNKVARDARWQIRVDSDFGAVMQACAQTRTQQEGTWITPDIITAYTGLHQLGHAHSVEVWCGKVLVGGLYGVNLGRMFFGESMFARIADASKIALAHLAFFLRAQGCPMIDCQQETQHLASLGARPISRSDFLQQLQRLIEEPQIAWPDQFDSTALISSTFS